MERLLVDNSANRTKDGEVFFDIDISGDSNRLKGIQSLISIFKTVLFTDPEDTSAHNELLHVLSDAAAGTRWRSFESFEADMLNPSTELDVAFIRACRMLASKYLIENQDKELNGIKISDAILLLNPTLR
jgi:hypothetical protein